MADTVTLPGVGPVKKGWAIGGVAVVALIVGIAYYRHSRNASTAAASTTTDTSTQDPNAIDPATGLTYGEEAAGIQAGDLAGYGSAYGDTSGIVGYDAQGNPVYADQVGYGPTPNFVNNAAWSQAAQQYLVASTGADAGTVAAALGTYLAGQPLTQAQASVVQQAIAFFGQPPQAGSNGYPPGLNMSEPQTGGTGGSSGGGTGGGSGGGTGGTGSGSGGTPAPAPAPAPVPIGPITNQVRELHVTKLFTNSAQVAWAAPVAQNGEMPTGYGVACYDSGGHVVNGPFSVPAGQLYANIGGLKSKTAYHANVWADPAPPNGPHQTVSFTTK